MPTGHASTHAMQVVQSHSSCGQIVSPWILRLEPIGSFMPYSHSLTSIILGESAFSVSEAGHDAWQRPQRVQASKSITCFQLNSSNLLMPKVSCSSIFWFGTMAFGG